LFRTAKGHESRLLPAFVPFDPIFPDVLSAFVANTASAAEENDEQQEEEQQTGAVFLEEPAVAEYYYKQQEEEQQAVFIFANSSEQSVEDTHD
jgi:hypothetical protein